MRLGRRKIAITLIGSGSERSLQLLVDGANIAQGAEPPDPSSQGGEGRGTRQLTQEKTGTKSILMLGVGWRNPRSAQYHVRGPLACIIIFSVRAARHVAEAY